jgi:hypothetical protein
MQKECYNGKKNGFWQGSSPHRGLEDAHKQQMPIPIKTEHVKGHQDKEKAFGKITIPERFNVCADHLVTYALDMQMTKQRESAPLLPLPRGSPYLMYEGMMQTSHERKLLHRHYAGSQLNEYRLTKHNWTEEQYECTGQRTR